MVQIMQNRNEKPSAIVCIAYRQMSTMTGIKDPTEPPKLEEIIQGNKQHNAIVKKSFADFSNLSMQTLLEFSREMAESFRLMLENLRVRIQQFREENQSIFDLFSISHLEKLTQREQ